MVGAAFRRISVAFPILTMIATGNVDIDCPAQLLPVDFHICISSCFPICVTGQTYAHVLRLVLWGRPYVLRLACLILKRDPESVLAMHGGVIHRSEAGRFTELVTIGAWRGGDT